MSQFSKKFSDVSLDTSLRDDYNSEDSEVREERGEEVTNCNDDKQDQDSISRLVKHGYSLG